MSWGSTHKVESPMKRLFIRFMAFDFNLVRFLMRITNIPEVAGVHLRECGKSHCLLMLGQMPGWWMVCKFYRSYAHIAAVWITPNYWLLHLNKLPAALRSSLGSRPAWWGYVSIFLGSQLFSFVDDLGWQLIWAVVYPWWLVSWPGLHALGLVGIILCNRTAATFVRRTEKYL